MRSLRVLALAISLVALVMIIAAGPGTRFGLWNFRVGLSVLRYTAYVAGAAIILTLLALAVTRPRGAALAVLLGALVVGCAAFAVPWMFNRRAKAAPPIHDISTDTKDPPAFVAVLPLRKDALNPATYGGDSVATQQQRAYPDIKPLELPAPPAQAFERALSVAKDMGWTIDDANAGDGRIEATDRTPWFGFSDDVVVRIRPNGAGSRVDVRSVSRVGKSDIGTNAARVRTYMEKLAAAL